ncbi:MAG: DHHA1 domain-containing protein, partial [Rhodospirillales bacterium]
LGDLIVHLGKVEAGTLSVGDEVSLEVDHDRRQATRGNHSVTHLLHGVLRRRLGEQVTQKGSMVGPERMRFDISYPHAIPAEELAVIEAEVNAQIRDNGPVETHLMDPEAAAAAGAMALFGEKYGDEVRVVMMGPHASGRAFSTELCGGTHVRRAGDIGLFKIVSESAVGAGIRRIEAVTGGPAVEHVAREEASLRELAQMLRAGPEELPRRVASLLEERRKLERELADARRALATGGGNGSGDSFREIAGIRYSPRLLDGVPARDLKSLADDLKKKLGSGVVALVSTADGKASLVVGVTDDLKERLSAIDLVRAGSMAVGGKGGGGRADMAQAGGPDVARAQAALDAIEQAIAAA